MADKPLSPFQIRNLGPSSQPTAGEGALIQISGPAYDRTISDNPAATLRYQDEDNDTIILGSSDELVDKLKEPIRQPSAKSSRKNKDRMSIAMLLSEAQQNPESLQHHVFDIDEREEIQKLWLEIQRRNRVLRVPNVSRDGLRNHWASMESAVPRLRGKGTREREIAGQSEGPNALDCALHHETTSRNEKSRNELVKGKLADAYQRHRKDMWTPIALELGVSWKEAEGLHWTLQDETRPEPHEVASAEKDASAGIESTKNVDSHRHEDLPSRTLPPFVVPKLEDLRALHFSSTKPPQLQLTEPANQTLKNGDNMSMTSKPSLLPTDEPPVTNLTVEGKRQAKAQAAGDILRARNTPSRHRKVAMTATDHTNHQNRWADYKSTDSAFLVNPFKSMPHGFDKPILTLEGKRQAQAAGDKLRCRTNPIRHSRPFRSGSLEHGVCKNRWSSYVTPRAARFDDKHHADAALIPDPQPEATKAKDADKQPTLLEVFEAELTKDPSGVNDAEDSSEFPDPEISSIPATETWSTASTESSNVPPVSETSFSQQPSALFAGIKMISDHLQDASADHKEITQELPQVIEKCVRTAVGGFDGFMQGFMQGLTSTLQEVSDCSQQAADTAREAETQELDGAIKGLRDLVVNLTAGLGGVGAEENEKTKSSNTDDTVSPPNRPVESDKVGNLGEGTLNSTPDSPTALTSPPEAQAVDVDASPNFEATAFRNHEVEPQSNSDQNCLRQAQSELVSSSHRDGTTEVPRYHEPGPIHLPNHAALSRSTSTTNPRELPIGSTNINHQHRARFNDYVSEGESRTTSPYPAATRFPTLAQFENGQSLAGVSSFPALPSMEPLVPQRAFNQTTGTSVDAKSRPTQDVAGLPRVRSQTEKTDSVIAATHLLMNNGINPGDLSDAQFASFQNQIPDVQQKSVEVYAKTLAKSILREQDGPKSSPSKPEGQRRIPRNSAKEDYEMQLRLLEQQNRKRSLLLRQQENASSRDLKLPRAFPSEEAHSTQSTGPSPAMAFEPHTSREARPRSAARLVEPFDPLEVEPSARPHLTEGIRRNATVAGTNSSHNVPRRRPYSEAYDGLGRVGWDSFLGIPRPIDQAPFPPVKPSLGASQAEGARQLSRDRHRRNQDRLKRSATVSNVARSSLGRQDDAPAGAAGAIADCVDTLYSLGYGDGDGDGDEDRLWVYAQASGGDLVEAIDMIDEEQRVYRDLS